jgi:methylated-DNA-[protein]-cysteine S-methyltransferase
MSGAAYCFFDTAIGRCAILWRGGAAIGAALPEDDQTQAQALLLQRFPGAAPGTPPADIALVVEAVIRLLNGEAEDFTRFAIDLGEVPQFDRRVLEATFTIPAGETRTYGEIARMIGAPGASRAVGRALGANPIPIIVPCHRVLAANGRSGGFSAPGGASTKLRLLNIEGARRGREAELFDCLSWQARPR